jgi:MFS transporter, DHA3 family, macrolide efflux protein
MMTSTDIQVASGQVAPQQLESRLKRNVWLLLSGRLVSDLGSYLYAFVISLYVLKETGSSMTFSTVLVFNLVPRIILGPFAGVLADRMSRKTLLVLSDLLSGVALLGLFAVVFSSGLHLAIVYTLAALLAVFNTFYQVAVNASIPNLVDEKRLTRVNSLTQSITSLTQVTSPVLGGLVYGLLDVKLFLLINGLSFLVSALAGGLLSFNVVTTQVQATADKVKNRMFREMQEGFAFVKKQPALLMLVLFALVFNFLIMAGCEVPVPVLVNQVLHMSSQQFGIISAAFPIGGVVGSLVLSFLPEFDKKFKVFTISFLIHAILVVLCGVPGLPALQQVAQSGLFSMYTVVYFVFGIVVVFINVPVSTMLMQTTSDEYRGRVFGLIGSLSSVVSPLGLLLSGMLIEQMPAYLIPIIAGGVEILFMVVFVSNKSIRTL